MKQRAMQVSQELRKIISMVLLEDVSDPRLGFVTITYAEVTDDLRHARVWYSVLGNEAEKKQTEEALEENLPFIRRIAVERINTKFAMDIRFERDKSIDADFELDKIIKKIKKKEEE